MVIVEKLVEWRLADETEVLWENVPQRHFVHHKSHMTRPRAMASYRDSFTFFYPSELYVQMWVCL
jgi:hypothetical protein